MKENLFVSLFKLKMRQMQLERIVKQSLQEVFCILLDKLGLTHQQAKWSLKIQNIVKLNVFLKDLNDFGDLNDTFADFFGNTNFPARSTIEVAGLPLGARVEIDCIAAEG
jgi:enamine deaminase RidA (YjgF/YER057c/UK114 family)